MMIAQFLKRITIHWRAMASRAKPVVTIGYLFVALFGLAMACNAQMAAADQSAPGAATAVMPQAPSASLNPMQKDCIEPEPTFTGLEYHGPFKNLVVRVAGK